MGCIIVKTDYNWRGWCCKAGSIYKESNKGIKYLRSKIKVKISIRLRAFLLSRTYTIQTIQILYILVSNCT